MEDGSPSFLTVNLMSVEDGPQAIAQLVRDVNVRVIKESEFDFLLKETVGV